MRPETLTVPTASDPDQKLSRPVSDATGLPNSSSRLRRSSRVTDSRGRENFGGSRSNGNEAPQGERSGPPRRAFLLNPLLRYQPNKLDSKGYPGQVIYRRTVVEQDNAASAVHARSAGAARAAGLLNSHISSSGPPWNPFDEGEIEIWQGARLIKVTKRGRPVPEEKERPPRGKVREFSRASRTRMRNFLGKVRLEKDKLPLFVTTTYPDIFPTEAEKFKRDLRTIIERLKRRFPAIGIVWRLEFKRRRSGVNVGKVAPHYHLLVWNVPRKFDYKAERGKWFNLTKESDSSWKQEAIIEEGGQRRVIVSQSTGQDRLTEWLSRNWYDVAGTGVWKHLNSGTNVTVLESTEQVFYYVSKYLGKVEEDLPCSYPGRFWGVVNPGEIPMGKRVVMKCSGKQAAQIMRWMRRYIHGVTQRKYWFNSWSMSCLCNADFWADCVEKVGIERQDS